MGIITGQNTITGWHCLFVVLLYTMARTSGENRYACDNETYSSGGMCEDDSNLTYVCCDPDTEINECESLPCANNATCNDATNGFTCTCMEGFTGRLCDLNVTLRPEPVIDVLPHVLWLTALVISNLITAVVIWTIWARRNTNRPT